LMQYRLVAQFVAIVLVVILVTLTKSGGH
jgi:hypothetical protein